MINGLQNRRRGSQGTELERKSKHDRDEERQNASGGYKLQSDCKWAVLKAGDKQNTSSEAWEF